MNRNFSEEIIEIEGKEYKLFLNRAGIAIWEKTTKFSEFQNLLAQKYSELGEDALNNLEEKIIDENAGQVAAYKAGKQQLFGFFVGQAMKATQGRANPQSINKLLKEALEN